MAKKPSIRSNRRLRLSLTKDLYQRRKMMLKRYSHTQLKQLAEQYGFDNVNHPEFINALVPPGTKDVEINQEEKGDDESPILKKRKNKKPQQLVHNSEEIQFTDAGTPIGDIKMDIIRADQYRDILKENNAERDMEHPQMIIPKPTEDEESTGFMFRYFLQQANSPTAPIIEVDKEQYEGWLKVGGGIDRTFYIGVVLKWRIRGLLETITGDDGIIRKGVLEGNQDSINLAAETIPALKIQINNLVKYWSR